jgi:SAM-dependent methyltransferase
MRFLRGMDIYLLDQVFRGRVEEGARVFETGCGGGRNLAYFLSSGYEVAAVDPDPRAIEQVRGMAAALAPKIPPENFRAEHIEVTSFPEHSADLVISCAVLHFARTDDEFRKMVVGSWRIVAPGGLFFCRLASTIGMEGRFDSRGGRRFLQPDGSERYLVDQRILLDYTRELGGELLDPIKTTVVQDQRCMTTWVMAKNQ